MSSKRPPPKSAPRRRKKAAKKKRVQKPQPKSTRGPGRPTMCKPTTILRICRALRHNAPDGVSYRAAGVSVAAASLWRVRAEKAMTDLGLDPEHDMPIRPELTAKGKEPPLDVVLIEWLGQFPEDERCYLEFFVLTTRAREDAHIELSKLVTDAAKLQAAKGDHRGGLAILERRHPKEWGRKDQMDLGLTPDASSAIKIFVPKEREEP